MAKKKCAVTGKEQHTQMSTIKAALSYSKKRGTPLRYYRCPSCKQFHLTKMPAWQVDTLRMASA